MKTDDCKILYFSPGYFHAREELFISLARHFKFRVVDISHNVKNGTPSTDYLHVVDNAIWDFPSAKLAKLSSWNVLRLAAKIYRELANGEYDLVISSTQHPIHSKIVFHMRSLFAYKVALVTEVWQYPPLESRLQRLYRAWSKHILLKADYVLCRGTRSLCFAEALGCAGEKCLAWPLMSVDLRSKPLVSSPSLKQVFARHEGRIKIGYVGRFVREKGLIELCEAFRTLQADASLFLVGAGPLAEQMRGFRRPGDGVEIVPWVEPWELPYLYGQFDVFVLPSYYDGFSTVCSEAASMSLPLIVSDQVGCAPDLVEEGLNGFVVPAENVEKLAGALDNGIRLGKEGLRQAGRRTRERFKSLNSFRIHHETIQSIVESINETP